MTWPEPPPLDSTWALVYDGFVRAREHELESLLTVANGYVGTRGSLSEGNAISSPSTLVAGVYRAPSRSNASAELAEAPDWTRLALAAPDEELTFERGHTIEHRRVLDLRRGMLFRVLRRRDTAGRVMWMQSLRFASLADRHVLVHSVTFVSENYSGLMRIDARIFGPYPPIEPTRRDAASAATLEIRVPDSSATLGIALADRLTIVDDDRARSARWLDAAAIAEIEVELAVAYRIDRMLCVHTSRDAGEPAAAAALCLERRLDGGAEQVIAAHIEAWSARWDTAEIEVDGDPEAARALHFACYHLISAANPEDDRVSIGARALTGPSYGGHVFWDTEIYMLPFFVFTHPPSARALLMYRHRTLQGAREKARAHGYRGALYVWESTDDGGETTPPFVIAPNGRVIPILSGEQEHHISADVAYAVWQYWLGTGDDDFLAGPGAEILFETARFWASRVEPGEDGLFHVRRVMGPDEYHEGVDDNAYTNEMARWNLERGVEAAAIVEERWPDRFRDLAARLGLDASEIGAWRRIAPAIYSGLDLTKDLYEQFRGYFELDEIDLAAFEPRTAPMDVLLGPDRTRRSKVVKQADVVLLLHLLGDRIPHAIAEKSFRYYESRTGHGSSLSPPVHALVAARLGDLDLAARYFRETADIDLADNMGNASGGVHAAALGGLWQAAVFGFAGMRMTAQGLSFAPRLPTGWRGLRFRVAWRGLRLVVSIRSDPLSIDTLLDGAGDLLLALEEGQATRGRAGCRYVASSERDVWTPWTETGL